MEAKKLNNISVADYISIEKENDIKYEYHNGTIYALAGGTFNHGAICGNIFGEMRSALKEKESDCRAYTSEIKVHIAKEKAYVYPDAMVICGAVAYAKNEINSITNPILIVEVLSHSTSNYDRGAKFHKYRQLESLQEYLLIEQDEAAVELYKRVNDLWKITRVEGLETSIDLSSLGISVKLASIYEGIVF